jgi:hypothetical protein
MTTHKIDLLEGDKSWPVQDPDIPEPAPPRFPQLTSSTEEAEDKPVFVVDTADEEDLRSFILGYDDRTAETVKVPMWGDREVEVRGMSGKGRAEFLRQSGAGSEGNIDFEAMYPAIVINTCYHPKTGRRLFNTEDMDALNQKSAAALEFLAEIGMRLSGMDKKTEERAGKASS